MRQKVRESDTEREVETESERTERERERGGKKENEREGVMYRGCCHRRPYECFALLGTHRY